MEAFHRPALPGGMMLARSIWMERARYLRASPGRPNGVVVIISSPKAQSIWPVFGSHQRRPSIDRMYK